MTKLTQEQLDVVHHPRNQVLKAKKPNITGASLVTLSG